MTLDRAITLEVLAAVGEIGKRVEAVGKHLREQKVNSVCVPHPIGIESFAFAGGTMNLQITENGRMLREPGGWLAYHLGDYPRRYQPRIYTPQPITAAELLEYWLREPEAMGDWRRREFSPKECAAYTGETLMRMLEVIPTVAPIHGAISQKMIRAAYDAQRDVRAA